jgi:hypothetical protein
MEIVKVCSLTSNPATGREESHQSKTFVECCDIKLMAIGNKLFKNILKSRAIPV